MRGLHPRIHLSMTMDCRVKPGNDELKQMKQQRADSGRSSGYITPARHVRAFGVGLDLRP
jgi:hypothetical protein